MLRIFNKLRMPLPGVAKHVGPKRSDKVAIGTDVNQNAKVALGTFDGLYGPGYLEQLRSRERA
jgi:hypothetical protein